MVRVKICGITSIEDARHAVACGADALGFVFFDKSPRCIGEAEAKKIIAGLPPFVTSVGLFVNEQRGRMLEVAKECRLDALQLHGDESPQDCAGLPLKVIKALRVRDRQSLQNHRQYAASLLLDAWDPDAYGGTGCRFDWSLAAELATERTLLLAGGLTPENVAEAVRSVRPYAVDVSSGVETSPGCKDPQRVAEFIRAAKEAR